MDEVLVCTHCHPEVQQSEAAFCSRHVLEILSAPRPNIAHEDSRSPSEPSHRCWGSADPDRACDKACVDGWCQRQGA